jgi:hypothetical protein
MGGALARLGEGRGVYRVFVVKHEGTRSLRRHRRKWEDNIKMNLQEVGCGGMDWIELTEDRDRWLALVNAVIKSAGKFLTSFSRRTLLHEVSEWVGKVVVWLKPDTLHAVGVKC